MKKGFTLIELAIALVVIGLILAMAMKGRAILDSAEIRSDMNKLNKVSAAVASYYSKYNRLPGVSDNTTASLLEDLTSEGLVSDADFSIELQNAFINVAGCTTPTTDGARSLTAAFNGAPNLCAFVSDTAPESATTAAADDDMIDTGAYGCYVELMLDNANLGNGIARGTGAVAEDTDCNDLGNAGIADFTYVLF